MPRTRTAVIQLKLQRRKDRIIHETTEKQSLSFDHVLDHALCRHHDENMDHHIIEATHGRQLSSLKPSALCQGRLAGKVGARSLAECQRRR